MTSMNVSLPEQLRAFVTDRAAGRFGSASEYVRELIREDQRRAEQEKLEALLIQGLASGETIEVTPEFWERKRQALLALHSRKNRKNGS
ncbi:MAG: type II toxin-antitoxin system ParD family antitoxin [Planctomycetes bacterium]|nr:type II toxin-antitoxin system ParD family antitoxin [Planctomycetota bacterium]MCB9917210.1 type II toxin-antitoxin system ParD family antitoxin [Planctomycetota bacterium]